MRRSWSGLAIVTAGLMLTAFTCDPPPPSTPGVPPVVSSVTVSSAPIVPGQSITIEATATHPEGLNNLTLQFSGPNGQHMGNQYSCGGPVVTQLAGTESTVAVECFIPGNVPNGNWTMRYTVWGINSASPFNFATSGGELAMSVVGGLNDHSAPVLAVTGGAPSTISRGGSFTISIQATDQSLPITTNNVFYMEQNGPFLNDEDLLECDPATVTPVSATTVDISIVCPVASDLTPGSYWGGYSVKDDFGQGEGIYSFIQVTA